VKLAQKISGKRVSVNINYLLINNFLLRTHLWKAKR